MATRALEPAAARFAAAFAAPRAVGDAPAPGDVAAPAADDDTFTDPQGRKFQRRIDQATGHTLWEHASERSDQAGNRLKVNIVIDIAPGGEVVRTDKQRIERATGDVQEQQVATHFDAQGARVREVTDGFEKTKQEGVAREEKTHVVGKIENEQLVHQAMDLDVTEQAGEAPGQTAKAHTTVKATWDEGGRPITQATVPQLDRQAVVRYDEPNGGIHKGHPRILTTAQHSHGPSNALVHDPMSLVVRWEGKKGAYMERHLEVPVNAQGQPEMTKARTVKNVDEQASIDKGMMQARIWGGFASNIALIAGVNLIRTSLGGLGRGLIAGSVLASGASLVGEGHALATQRNDASWARLAMGVYDTAWSGMFAALVLRRPGARAIDPTGSRFGPLQLAGTAGGASAFAGRLALNSSIGADGEGTAGWAFPKPNFSAITDMPTVPLGLQKSLSHDLSSVQELGREALERPVPSIDVP